MRSFGKLYSITKYFSAAVFLLLTPLSFAGHHAESEAANPESKFDPALAKEVGADAYGMRSYVMAFLKKGPNRDLTAAEATELQAAHMKNIVRMAKEGTLVLAGPFFGDGEIRGIYIFAVDTVEEAKALTETDPAVKAGSLEMELHKWYGSAALMKVNEIHGQIAKEGI